MESENHELFKDLATQRYDRLGREIREKMELQAAYELVRQDLQGQIFQEAPSSDRNPGPIPQTGPGKPVEDPRIDLTGLSVDFTGAPNVLERVLRIGEAAGGRLLNATKVARFLIEAGVSRGKLENLRGNVSDALTGNPDYFMPVGPATFQFLGRDASPSVHPDETPIGGEEGLN